MTAFSRRSFPEQHCALPAKIRAKWWLDPGSIGGAAGPRRHVPATSYLGAAHTGLISTMGFHKRPSEALGMRLFQGTHIGMRVRPLGAVAMHNCAG